MSTTPEQRGDNPTRKLPIPRAMMEYLYDAGPSRYYEVRRGLSANPDLDGLIGDPDIAIETLSIMGLATYSSDGSTYALTDFGERVISGLREDSKTGSQ